MGEFVISYRTNGQYYFALTADNGKAILLSSGYTSKWGINEGIKEVKTFAKDESNYIRKTSTNNKFYFELRTPYGLILMESKLYTSPIKMEGVIEAVRKDASDAPIVNDQTAKRA
jgi:uncharacterized protein YegP (UPF0339 family)